MLSNKFNRPIGEQAKERAISIFTSVVSGLTDKKLWERYTEQTIVFDEMRREIRAHREMIAELNRKKSIAKKGVEIIEKELKRRKIFYE